MITNLREIVPAWPAKLDLMKLTVTMHGNQNLKEIKSFFVNHVRASVRRSLQYFIWLKSKRVKICLVVKG